MKNLTKLGILSFFLIIGLGLTSCGSTKDMPNPPDPAPNPTPPTPPEPAPIHPEPAPTPPTPPMPAKVKVVTPAGTNDIYNAEHGLNRWGKKISWRVRY